MTNQFSNNLLKFAVCLCGLLMGSKCVAQRFTSSKDAEAFERAFGSVGKEFYEPSGDLNDDEMHSPHMPEYFVCDACHILTYKFNRRFDFENEKRPSLNKKLPVTDILEAVEEVCSDGFTELGVKEVDGVKRLSGPGSSAHSAGGMMHGGGLWPLRMQNMCSGLVDEYELMYKAYREDQLRMYLCDDPNTGYCKLNTGANTEQLKVEPQTPHAETDKEEISMLIESIFGDFLFNEEEGPRIENEQDGTGDKENGRGGGVTEERIEKEEL